MSRNAGMPSPCRQRAPLRTAFSRLAALPPAWPAALVVALAFALGLASLAQKSPTMDEQGFLLRGVAWDRGANRAIRVGHPAGLNALNGLLVAADPRVQLPTGDPSWSQTSFHRPAELFLWEIGNDVERVMLLGRLPTLWLALLAGAVVYRWAWQLAGRRQAGLLALLFFLLDPNILAHARLVTTDLGLASGAALAGYTLWRALRRPSWGRVALAGAAFGLLQDTKFTAGLFVPLFTAVVLVSLLATWRRSPRLGRRLLLQLLLAYPLAAFLTLWAAYGFQVGPMPAGLPLLGSLAGRTVPLSRHLEQLADIGRRLGKSTPSFLAGRYSEQGWPAYFPLAFLLKTPLPTLLLLGWAAIQGLRRRLPASMGAASLAAVLLPPLGYFAIALTSTINLGYRHLLPLLPFLLVFAAALVGRGSGQGMAARLARPLLAGWLLLATLIVYPDFLAFFNALAGGPDGGWRYLVDSNLDWGQDLGRLKGWMEANQVDEVWLSYFGEARPDYYGLRYRGLDSFPPRLMDPEARPFYPSDPSPGVYAISATNLQGVLFQDHDEFAWFRQRQPLAKVGYSIFLYRVPASGPPLSLALGGVQLDQLSPDDHARLGSNDLRLRWFDPAQAWILPAAGSEATFYALDPAVSLPAAWAEPLAGSLLSLATGPGYRLARLPQPEPLPLATGGPSVALALAGSRARLLGAELPGEPVSPGTALELVTAWELVEGAAPGGIFLHLLDLSGQIVSQWDGLGLVDGWQPGDRLWQRHELPLPPDLAPGRYELVAGMVDASSGRRWQAEDGRDSFALGQVTLSP